jgi:hypothetical protein
LPTSAVTIPRPTQKSTQMTIVAGFSKKSSGPKSPPTSTSPRASVKMTSPIVPSRSGRIDP